MEKWPIGVFTSIDAGLGVKLEVAHELGERPLVEFIGVPLRRADRVIAIALHVCLHDAVAEDAGGSFIGALHAERDVAGVLRSAEQ